MGPLNPVPGGAVGPRKEVVPVGAGAGTILFGAEKNVSLMEFFCGGIS